MVHPVGVVPHSLQKVSFDSRVRLEFRGSQLSSDAGLLVFRELDEALGLCDLAQTVLTDDRTGKNKQHDLAGLFRQNVFSRLAGYEDVNDAKLLSQDLVMRQIVGGRAIEHGAASPTQMGRF
jgi:hypothetical protein